MSSLKNLLEPASRVEDQWERAASKAYISFSCSLALVVFITGVFVVPPVQGVDQNWDSYAFWVGIFAPASFLLGAYFAREGELRTSAIVNVMTILLGSIAASIQLPWVIVMASTALIVSGALLAFQWSLVVALVVVASPPLILLANGTFTPSKLLPLQVPNLIVPIAFLMAARLKDQIERGQRAYFEQREAEETTKRKLEEELQEARKLESLGRLAGGVAHDFNNQLTVILGGCSLLEAGVVDAKIIESIRQAAEHSGNLTEQLLAYSRKQPHKLEVLDLAEVIGESQGMLRKLVAEHCTLELELACPQPWVRGDRTQMQQLLFNLVGNASDSMPDGGRVSVTLEIVEANQIHAPELEDQSYLRLSVADRGHGMDDETQQQIFEPFFTTKKLGRGTGLGLATVHGIVRGTGGHVTVESKLGVGTQFHVYLPLSTKGPSAPSDERLDKNMVRGMRVLIVDDQSEVGEMTCANLRELGAKARFAHGPEAARKVIAEDGPVYDLLVTDVLMPGTNGIDLAAELTSQCPNMAVLYVSGHTAGAELTSEELLTKPFHRDELALACARVLVLASPGEKAS